MPEMPELSEMPESMTGLLELANRATQPTVLPDCRASTVLTPKGSRFFRGYGWWVPVYCANCGTPGGFCPEDGMDFLFYLCNGCAETHGEIAGTYLVPDEVFYAKLADVQLTHYGRVLSPHELRNELANPDSAISRLAKDRAQLTPS